jgi:hypothetical protein
MKFINTYKKFESVDESEVADNIQDCLDWLETFHEFEEDIETVLHKGWFSIDGQYYDGQQRNEKDLYCFQLVFLKKDSQYEDKWYSNRPIKINQNKLDETLDLINKSKSFLKKLQMWSNDVRAKITNTKIEFLVIFENIDKESKKTAKFNRIYQGVYKYFQDRSNDYARQTINLLQFPGSQNPRTRDIYQKLWDMVKENPVLKDSTSKPLLGKFNEARDNFQLRFACSVSRPDDETIQITIGPFKYKCIYYMEKYYQIKLGKEEISEVCEIVKDRLLDNYSISRDKNSIKATIEGNKIIFKIS